MELKVVIGPACSATLRLGIEERIRQLTGDSSFQVTVPIVRNFADGEGTLQLPENVRGCDVCIVQPTNPPHANRLHMEQLLQAAALSSATRVTAVLPYMGGLRQDRKDKPRVAITARLNAQAIQKAMEAAAHRQVVILHPHFPQVSGFFDIASDLLLPVDLFLQHMEAELSDEFDRLLFVAPDPNAAPFANLYRKRTKKSRIGVGLKERTDTDQVYISDVIGVEEGDVAVIVDDIIDTGGTFLSIIKKLRERGITRSYAYITHPVLAGPAIERLREATQYGFQYLVVTNSIDEGGRELPLDLIKIVDCGSMIGEAIWRNHTNGSISDMAGMFAKVA